MKLPFTKMHGISNDYVYVNAFATKVADPATVAQKVSDRRTGIGGDGLILFVRRILRMPAWRCTTPMVAEARCAAMAFVVSASLSSTTVWRRSIH